MFGGVGGCAPMSVKATVSQRIVGNSKAQRFWRGLEIIISILGNHAQWAVWRGILLLNFFIGGELTI